MYAHAAYIMRCVRTHMQLERLAAHWSPSSLSCARIVLACVWLWAPLGLRSAADDRLGCHVVRTSPPAPGSTHHPLGRIVGTGIALSGHMYSAWRPPRPCVHVEVVSARYRASAPARSARLGRYECPGDQVHLHRSYYEGLYGEFSALPELFCRAARVFAGQFRLPFI